MSLRADKIMTRDVVTARPEDTVARVAHLLAEKGISAVPVCDEDGRLLGMISEGDLMRPFGQAKMLKRSWWLDLLAEGTELAPAFLDYLRLDKRQVRDLMTHPVITAPHDAEVSAIADQMSTHRIKRLPIMRDGHMVGIISRADIVRALAQAPSEVMEPV